MMRWRGNPWPIEPLEVEGEFAATVEGVEYEFEYAARLSPGGLNYFPDEAEVDVPVEMPMDVWERNKEEIVQLALDDAYRRRRGENPRTWMDRTEWRMEDVKWGQGHYFLADTLEEALLEALELAEEKHSVVTVQKWKPRKGPLLAVIPTEFDGLSTTDILDRYEAHGWGRKAIGEVLARAQTRYLPDDIRTMAARRAQKAAMEARPKLVVAPGITVENPEADTSLEPRMYRCNKCGDSDSLAVVECTVTGDMKLEDDGFLLSGDSEDEVVVCHKCGEVHYGLPFAESQNPAVDTSFGLYDFRIVSSNIEAKRHWRSRATKIATVFVQQKRPIEEGDFASDIAWRRTHERPFGGAEILGAVRAFLEAPGKVKRVSHYRQSDGTYKTVTDELDKPPLRIRAFKPIQYSRYAGCSMCPCSPGYNVYGDMEDRDTNRFAIEMDLKIWVEAVPGGVAEASTEFQPGARHG